MTKQQASLIKTSFEFVKDNPSKVGKSFYKILFEKCPETRRLFGDDIANQEKKLMDMISIAVANIDELATVASSIRELGQRHVAYGVNPEDYQIVGEVLLQTLKNELGVNINSETEQAWAELYNIISKTMQS